MLKSWMRTWLPNQSESRTTGMHPHQTRKHRPPQQDHSSYYPRLEMLEDRLVPSTFTVTNNQDSGAGSLRDAINNLAQNGDTINFQTPLTGGNSISLTSGNLDVTKNITITGPGANVLSITSNFTQASGGVFLIQGQVKISGMTITGADVSSSGSEGGGIFVDVGESLTLDRCVLSNNKAALGGAIHVTGATAILSNCTISGNSASTNGGEGAGIDVDAFASQTASLTMTSCTVSDNLQKAGVNLVAQGGGPVSATLTNCTIADNANGEGIRAISLQSTPLSVTLENDIIKAVSSSFAAFSFSGSGASFTSKGNNLVSDSGGNHAWQASDLLNTDPLLAPLADYGGPAPTMALLPGSPAIDAGTSTGAPAQDQRGVSRAGSTDIGAFESRKFTLIQGTGNNQAGTPGSSFPTPLSVTIEANSAGEPVDGGQVIFSGPATGAGITGSPVNTAINSGIASTSVTANGTGGSYVVTASANGAIPSVGFNLSNNAPPAITSANNAMLTVGSNGTFNVTATGNPLPTLGESGTLPSGITFGTGGTLLSNLPGNDGAGRGFGVTQAMAVGFTPNASSQLTVAHLRLSVFNVNETIVVSIFNNNAGKPGSLLQTLINPTFTASQRMSYAFMPSAPLSLTSGTTYWLVLQYTAGGQALTWIESNPQSSPSGAGATSAGTQFANPFPNWTNDPAECPSFDIQGSLGSPGTATGTLSGIPSIGSGGTYPLTFTAHNGVGPDATQSFTLTVNEAPSITSLSSHTFAVGTAGSFQLSTLGFPKPSFSESGTLPNGLTFDTATGTLSGTAAAGSGGTYHVSFSASNGVGSTASQNFTLTVNEAPGFNSAGSATFTVGSSGSVTVSATGFPNPILSESGTLPTGVTFNTSTGVLSGTPTAGTGGTYNITFTATNGVGTSASRSFTLSVNEPAAITSNNNTSFTKGSSGSFTVTATGFPAPTLSESGALPAGITFNSSTGVLSGMPAVGSGGNYNISFTASNGVGSNAIQSFTLTVNSAPSITSANNKAFSEGSSGSFTVTATGFPASALSESGTLPGGLTFDPSTGLLSGTPLANTAGIYDLTFTASNGVGSNASQTFTLTVARGNPTVVLDTTAPDPTNSDPIHVSATFSASVTGFTADDLVLGNGTVSSFAGSGTSYSFDVTPAGPGLVTVDLPANLAQTSAGIGNLSANQLSRTFDNIQPSVVMASGSPDPTNGSPIHVTATFSRTVTGFSADDVTVVNATVINFSGSGSSYAFDLTPTGQGLVTADIAAGVASDAVGNTNKAAPQLPRLFDTVSPSVTLSSTAPDPTNLTSIPVAVEFSEPVTGFDASDLSVTNASVSGFTGSGSSYSFNLIPTSQGAITVDIAAGGCQDVASNGNQAAAQLIRTFASHPTPRIDGSTTNEPGHPFVLSLSTSGSDGSTIAAWIVNWGDGTTQELAGNPSSAMHFYPGISKPVTVSASIREIDSTITASNSLTLDVELPTDSQRWLAHFYQDLLGRPVDSNGLESWQGLLESGFPRFAIAEEIQKQPESLNRAVSDLYQHLFGQAIDQSTLQKLTGLLAAGGTMEQVSASLVSMSDYLQGHGQSTSLGFLTALYQDFFHRSLDSSGHSTFLSALNAGVTPTQIADTLFASDEYRQDVVNRDFQTFFHRPATADELAKWSSYLQQGKRDEQVVGGMVDTADYFAPAGAESTTQRYVARVYSDLLGRMVDGQALSLWTGRLDSGTSRSEFTTLLSGSVEYKQKVLRDLYASILGRPIDNSGLSVYTAFLSAGGRIEAVRAALLGSDEFFLGHSGGSNARYLDALGELVLGQPFDATTRATFDIGLKTGATPTEIVATALSKLDARRVQVQRVYASILLRNPNESELQSQIALLQAGGTEMSIVAALLGSDEYFARRF